MRFNHLISFYENYYFCLNSNIIKQNNGPSAWKLMSFDVDYSSE